MIKMSLSDFLPRNCPNSSVDIFDLLPRKWANSSDLFFDSSEVSFDSSEEFFLSSVDIPDFLGSYLEISSGEIEIVGDIGVIRVDLWPLCGDV